MPVTMAGKEPTLREAASRVYEWQTPLLARFYLNISYGRCDASLLPKEETANRLPKGNKFD